ncbi:hypothetical protein HU200_025426 [Digitaria exilis]|uniref:Calmodulin-binding domain-containing protein n=1 Tax=Digitaria exilis TaxID=1010633 RepID=A0A835EV34_9POAL|nr:hypothetical protein HU200_025426 [Digitaria exilis]
MSKALEKSSPGGSTPSSASPSELKKHEKTVPNYLRASRGSCHDLCKYGHKKPSEEEPSLSGGRRKKLPAHLKNLTLHRSAILDRPKDVRNISLSLAKSSISLGEAARVAPRIASANKKGVGSNEHMVPEKATSDEHKNLNSEGRKKYSVVAQKVSTNLRYSNEVKKIDKMETVSAKGATFPAKTKFPEKTLMKKSITVDKVTTANQSWDKRPASSPSKPNITKQVYVPSQASSHYVLLKHKSTQKGKVTSPAETITRVHAKPGQSATRSSAANRKGKEGLDMSGSSLSVKPKLIASVEEQKDDLQIRGYYIESIQAELSPDATEYVDNSQPAPVETSKSISEDDVVWSTEKGELIAGEALMESVVTLEQQESLDSQEFNATLGESDPECKLAEQNIINGQASKAEDGQTDAAALCRLSEHITTVENTDMYDSLWIGNDSKIEDDQVEVNAYVEPLISECKEQVSVCEDLGTSPELLAVHEKHVEEPESCLDFASGNAIENVKADEFFDDRVNNSTSHCQSISETSSDSASGNAVVNVKTDEVFDARVNNITPHCQSISETSTYFASGNEVANVKADEVFDVRVNNSTSHCQSISETSSDGGLLEEPKSMLIEPSDSAVDELTSVSNERTIEQDGLKSKVFISQSPEELSDDEFYEEYDFESSESGTEDEEVTTKRERDESLKSEVPRQRRISAIELDDANITPYKMKFKRGKIVELPLDSSGPRRLKFRRKSANEVSNRESQPKRRIYKRNSTSYAAPTDPHMESPGVKLRHQDAQEKKDAQGLFNNVIEETASKLVESRKSKVKALVGAFETVISLQDGKPASSTQQAGNSQDLFPDDERNAPEEAE